MMLKKPLTLLLASIIISGCASNNVPNSHTLAFKTRIVDKTLKQFKIQMQPKFIQTGINTNKALKAKRQSGRAQFSEERSIDLKRQKILLSQLNQTINENNYCTQGYWIIDTNVHTNAPFLLGECNDTATPNDLKQFSNSISQW